MIANHRSNSADQINIPCLPVECDLSERPAAARFVDETVKAFGGLDIAVFTPSLHASREFLDLIDEEWESR